MRRLSVFLITIILTLSLVGCGSDKEEVSIEEEIPETTEQVAVDLVTDYSKLSPTELEVLAYEGDLDAMYYLGLAYEYGSDSVNQDFAKALDWYTQAAEQDYADAVCAIGYFYFNGCAVDADAEVAKEYFTKAVELGSNSAKVGLARIILSTLTDNDISMLADVYAESLSDEELTDEHLMKVIDDSNQIYELVKSAASSDEIDGAYYMGYCYQKGIGVKSNPQYTLTYYQRVATASSTAIEDQYVINEANIALGLMYMSGADVVKDQEKAFEYFNNSAQKGYPKALYYMGKIYENGIGVEQDYEAALDYYLKAGESDFAPALNQIGYLYYNGYGVDVDFSSAVYYQKLAALQGYAPAQVNLGYLYENGYGVERNLETALSYYELAAASEYEGAVEAALRVRAQISNET